jgi:hypothetical protein
VDERDDVGSRQAAAWFPLSKPAVTIERMILR